MKASVILPGLLAGLVLGWGGTPDPSDAVEGSPAACLTVEDPPEYYAVSLVPTRRVTGTGSAGGVAHATFQQTPFGVSVAPDGSYRLTLHVQADNLPSSIDGEFVAWATTPSLDEVARIGPLDENGTAEGAVEWNKFLVVVTLEPEGTEEAERWSGPVVLRGMSRSGRMHTMAGHGPFEQQECAAFGY